MCSNVAVVRLQLFAAGLVTAQLLEPFLIPLKCPWEVQKGEKTEPRCDLTPGRQDQEKKLNNKQPEFGLREVIFCED